MAKCNPLTHLSFKGLISFHLVLSLDPSAAPAAGTFPAGAGQIRLTSQPHAIKTTVFPLFLPAFSRYYTAKSVSAVYRCCLCFVTLAGIIHTCVSAVTAVYLLYISCGSIICIWPWPLTLNFLCKTHRLFVIVSSENFSLKSVLTCLLTYNHLVINSCYWLCKRQGHCYLTLSSPLASNGNTSKC